MMTFSNGVGTSTQATTYNIIGTSAVDLTPVLDILHDNTDYEITPEYLRNSVLTAYSSSAFKVTIATQSTISYIGIDSGNQDFTSKDVKDKIYIGKRAYSGTHSYTASDDIMTSTMLNRSDDIFFYNTKRDVVTNYRTRISILAGTNSSLFSKAPYLQSQIVTVGSQSTLSLDLSNETTSGGTDSTINIKSLQGTASLNGVTFPTIQDSYSYAGDGKVLSWSNGVMAWDNINFTSTNFIGVTGSPTNIFGTPVNLNGYALDFTATDPCPIAIGDINPGETFNSVSIFEMLERICYSYLPPNCTLSIQAPYNSGYVEVGSSPKITLAYTIKKRTLPTLSTSLAYMIPSIYPAITTNGPQLVSGTATGVLITPVTTATSSFTITVNDGVQSNSVTATIKGVYPYFYGFSGLSSITSIGLASFNKLVEPQSDKKCDIIGYGNLYFIYDDDYPQLSDVLDENNSSVISNFTLSTVTLSSPIGIWSSKKFKVYQWNGHAIVGPPSVVYQFKY